MIARLLALNLLVAPAVLAEGSWAVEDALVSVEHGPAKARVSAASTAVAGSLREGPTEVVAHFRIGTFFSGTPLDGEILIDGTATPERNGRMVLRGTLTFHGAQAPVMIPLTVSRMGGRLWLHAVLTARVPDLPSELRLQLDGGLLPDATAVAAR